MVCGSEKRCQCAHGYRAVSHAGRGEVDPAFRERSITAGLLVFIVVLVVVVVAMVTYMINRFWCTRPETHGDGVALNKKHPT